MVVCLACGSLTKATERRNICSSSSKCITAMGRKVKHIVFPKLVGRIMSTSYPLINSLMAIICWGFTDEKPNLLTALFMTFSTLQRDNTIILMSDGKMLINEILRSDWCCDYSCSDTNAIHDCHQTLALHALVWLHQTNNLMYINFKSQIICESRYLQYYKYDMESRRKAIMP